MFWMQTQLLKWTGVQSISKLEAACIMKLTLYYEVIHFFQETWNICSKFQPAGGISNNNQIYTSSHVTNQKMTQI